jgi:hypothetical protein
LATINGLGDSNLSKKSISLYTTQHLYEKREGSGSIPLTNGSGTGSRRPKNMRILQIRIWLRIRIPNTDFKTDVSQTWIVNMRLVTDIMFRDTTSCHRYFILNIWNQNFQSHEECFRTSAYIKSPLALCHPVSKSAGDIDKAKK